MKEKIVPILLVIFVVLVSFAYADKAMNKEIGVDKMRTVFEDMCAVVPPGSNISLANIGLPQSECLNSYLMIRYVLAPRHISLDAREYDTVLTIFAATPTPPQFDSFMINKRLLWYSRISPCALTCRKK